MVELNETETKGFTVDAENPPLAAASRNIDINGDPEAMWGMLEEEGSMLGSFPPCWQAIYTGRQAVPEEDPNAVSFMIAPRKGEFSTIQSLTTDELAAAFAFIKKFINNDKRFVGFNISDEKRDRRDQVQSWANFHIHCLHLPEKMQPITKLPDRMRERLTSLTEGLLVELLAPVVHPDEAEVVNEEDIPTDLVFPRGRLYLELPSQQTPEQLAELVKKLDSNFRLAHEQVYSLFVKNYGQRDTDGKLLPYILREANETRDLISSSLLQDKTRKQLIEIVGLLKPEDGLADSQKFFQLPTYTADIFRDKEGNFYLVWQPYLLRRMGVIESVGVYSDAKVVEGAPTEKRRERAKQAFQSTLANLKG